MVTECIDPPYTVEFGSDDATSLANAKARATVELRKYMQIIKIAQMYGGARYAFGSPFNPLSKGHRLAVLDEQK